MIFLMVFNIIFFIYHSFGIKSSTGIFYICYLLNTPYLTLYTIFNINTFSLIFILLTNIIIILSIIWSWNFYWNIRNLLIFFLFLDFLLKGCFCSHDIFTFFIFFESILISMLFFIGILGLHERKVKAVYFFTYILYLGLFLCY